MDIDPASNTVSLASGGQLGFGHLVVCPGLQLDWDKIPGLADAVHSPSGASHYEFTLAAKSWTLLSGLKAGTAVFTMPSGPIKCGGAAQKPMYLACDYWRKQGVLQDIRVVMVQPYPTVFGVPGVDEELNRKIAEYGIELRLNSELVSVDASAQNAMIRNNATGIAEELHYDVLNAVPPQSAPDWLKATELPAPGDSGGFVDVDPQTLRHVRFPNIWSLGDAAADHQLQVRRCAAKADEGPGQEPGRGPGGKTPDGEVRRILGLPLHGCPLYGCLRRVRRPVPAHALYPEGANVEREPRIMGCGPRYLPQGLLESDPQGPSLSA